MNLDDTIRLQALKQKELSTRGYSGETDLVDLFANDPDHAEAMKAQTKNICAHISLQLFNEVEFVCSTLSLSKRRFVELALIDALDKSAKIIDEVGPFDQAGETH